MPIRSRSHASTPSSPFSEYHAELCTAQRLDRGLRDRQRRVRTAEHRGARPFAVDVDLAELNGARLPPPVREGAGHPVAHTTGDRRPDAHPVSLGRVTGASAGSARRTQSDRANERERTGRQCETDHHRRPPARAARRPARTRTSAHPATTATATASRCVVDRAAWRSVSIRRTRARSRTRAQARGRRARRPPDRQAPRARGSPRTTSPIDGQPAPSTRDEHQREVTDSATDATMYGAIATTRRPIWVPTSSPYAAPRTRPAISAPATAKIPAVAATRRSAGQADASTWRATRRGSSPSAGQRHGGDQPERRGTDADDRGRDQVCVAEARHRADALARGDRQADEVDRLQGERQRCS